MLKVTKFGGSSLCDSAGFSRVREIVLADPARRVVVVSAAGRRHAADHKITDLLYLCHAHLQYGVSCWDLWRRIADRYREIRDGCCLTLPIEAELDAIYAAMRRDTPQDWIVSRGEYLSARLMADLLGFEFVDAKDWLLFDAAGRVRQAASYAALGSLADGRKIVTPGFAHLKPGADYDNLYQSALCRAQADWLVGINATRLFSILYHKTLTVGRVQTPTLNMLVDREAKISNFKKEKYHIVHIAAGGMEAASDRFMNPDDADATKTACAGAQAVCVSVKREKKAEQPPRLYDLTTLQREANRLFGFTAKQTLDYAQQLYEKKLLTYPRTDSQYLTDDMQPTAESIVSGLWPLLSFAAGLDIAPQFGRVLNSKKVSDHHAIIPTMEFVQKGFDGLTEGEKKLLSLVCCKLLCAVAAPHVYEAVTTTFTCAGNEFTAKGKTILTPCLLYTSDAADE